MSLLADICENEVNIYFSGPSVWQLQLRYTVVAMGSTTLCPKILTIYFGKY